MRGRSVLKIADSDFGGSAGVKKAAGRDFLAASRPASTILLRSAGAASFGTMSMRRPGEAGVGQEMRGDARAHGAGAENSGFLNSVSHTASLVERDWYG